MSLIHQNLNVSRDPDHSLFGNRLSSVAPVLVMVKFEVS